MKTITCIFCGSSSSHVAIVENGYQGRKCSNCDLIYISPRPSASDIATLYSEHHAVQDADVQFKFEGFKRMEASRTLLKIGNFVKAGAILELGPGGGSFLEEARNLGYKPYGIEPNPIEAHWINEYMQIPCETSVLSQNSFGGRKFDIVYHRDVLSHLYDPLGVFCDINRSMKKNGLLVFETGNIADVRPKLCKLFAQFSYPDHLFFFGEKAIGILLERTGFKPLRVFRYPILLQIFMQKVFWGMKDQLKDKKTLENLTLRRDLDPNENRVLSMKRKLRLVYRYFSHYLGRIGTLLPSKGWPLKLIVFAEKQCNVV